MKKRLRFAGFVLAISWGLARGQAQESGPIVRLDPALDKIVPAGAQLERLADGFVFLEGPVWVRKGGYLLFSNMPEHVISKWTPDGKIAVFLKLTDLLKSEDPNAYMSNGTTLDKQGRLVFCAQTERAILRLEKDGKLTTLVDRYEGKRLNNPNDLVYKSNGSLYFTTSGRLPNAELPNVVYLLKGGKVQVATDQLVTPNGIAISADEKVLYVNDITKKIVWRFDIQPDDTVTNPRVFVDMNSDPRTGGPDGVKVDKTGNVYSAGPGGLWILSPEGKRLGMILTPDRVSNLAFGDDDGKTLYLTLHNALYRVRLNLEGVRP